MNNFCVYAYYDPKDVDKPFYIGAGGLRRARTFLRGLNKKVVDKIKEIDVDYLIVSVLARNLSKDKAHAIEIKAIKHFGKICNSTGCLLNIADGGPGTLGSVLSLEHKQKISSGSVNKTFEYRENMPKSLKGRNKSLAWINKIASANRINSFIKKGAHNR